MATTATGAVQGPRGVAPLVRTAPAESLPGQLSPGDVVSSRSLVTIEGESIQIPESQRLVHLQFRRYAGCPVCNLHLRTVAKRHDELVDAGITEVVVFHSTAETMVRFQADLPFAAVADPERHLYREFGVSKKMSARSALNPRTWRAAGRALAQAPNLRGAGGMGEKHNGLPADFLIESDGRVIAANYGRFIDDHWSVDDVLELAGGRAAWDDPRR